jgi:hypothetical protein
MFGGVNARAEDSLWFGGTTMKADRFGSYSIRSTVAAESCLRRLKSMMR